MFRSPVVRAAARCLNGAARSVSQARPVVSTRVPSVFSITPSHLARPFSSTEAAVAKDELPLAASVVKETPEAPAGLSPPEVTPDFEPEHERKIYVGNLAWKVQSQDLEEHFSQWGEIKDARVIMDRENPFRSRGFGFVTFAKKADAENAAQILQMNNEKEWLGRSLRVNISTPRAPRDNFGGGGSFGGGSGGYGGGRGQIRTDE